jgi:hypothetical protein
MRLTISRLGTAPGRESAARLSEGTGTRELVFGVLDVVGFVLIGVSW